MTASPFRTALRSYVAKALDSPGEHARADLAQAFLAAHPDLAQAALATLAERQVDTLIRQMCDAEPEGHQMSFFPGLPAAIAVAPGSVKAIEHCTPEDLAVGEQHRKDNITATRDRLKSYRRGVQRFLSQRVSGETVGDTGRRLAERKAAS